MLTSEAVTPLSRFCQVAPPSFVARMEPARPTAQPWVELAKSTEVRDLSMPLALGRHVTPASALTRIVPPPPTAQT